MLYLSSTQDQAFVRKTTENALLSDLIEALEGNAVFIDVGANCGYYSSMAARRLRAEGATVISFEPSSREYIRLVWAVENNEHRCDWLTFNCAVGSSVGTARLSCGVGHTGMNRVMGENSTRAKTTVVPIVTLDSVLEGMFAKARTIDLIKIDVEGFEMEVLKGAVGMLSRKLVKKLCIEITDKFLKTNGSSKEELYKFMSEFGYTAWVNSDEWQYDEVFSID